MASEMILHFPGWYSQCLVAGRHLLIYSLASPHANIPWREHHWFSAPCSAPSTCCQWHPRQPGTKHQCHPWRKYRHTDGSPRQNREWRSAPLRLWQSRGIRQVPLVNIVTVKGLCSEAIPHVSRTQTCAQLTILPTCSLQLGFAHSSMITFTAVGKWHV